MEDTATFPEPEIDPAIGPSDWTDVEAESGHAADAAPGPAEPPSSGPVDLNGSPGWLHATHNGQQPTPPGPPPSPPKRAPLPSWKDRPYFLERCIFVGLTAPQIALLSLQTPQPLRTHQQVYEAIESAGLQKLYKKPVIERRRIGPHNKLIIQDFMHTVGQAYSLGMEVREISRDEMPHPKCRLRPDLGYRLAWPGDYGRLFFDERQISKLNFTRWFEKLRAYVKLYENRDVWLAGDNFRCNITLLDQPTLNKVRYYAQELLYKQHPSLNLFNFITDYDRNGWNTVTEPVWTPTWDHPDGRTRKVSLM